jgi:hypothetical protein
VLRQPVLPGEALTVIELTSVRRAGNRIEERGVCVDPTTRRVAELTAELVCRRLGIPTVRVRWLAADRRDVRGETLPSDLGEIWVRAGQSVAATIETTAHECRHLWQLTDCRWIRPGLQTDEERERDADDYGLAIRAELT